MQQRQLLVLSDIALSWTYGVFLDSTLPFVIQRHFVLVMIHSLRHSFPVEWVLLLPIILLLLFKLNTIPNLRDPVMK